MRALDERLQQYLSYEALVAEPFDACVTLGHYLQNRSLGAKVLHVELSRELALRVEDECRALQVGQSQVVEVLLRSWLTGRGRTNFE